MLTVRLPALDPLENTFWVLHFLRSLGESQPRVCQSSTQRAHQLAPIEINYAQQRKLIYQASPTSLSARSAGQLGPRPRTPPSWTSRGVSVSPWFWQRSAMACVRDLSITPWDQFKFLISRVKKPREHCMQSNQQISGGLKIVQNYHNVKCSKFNRKYLQT